jgi:hypothetical protein
LLVGLATPAAAQVPDPDATPGSELTVYLMTMGQGDQVWERYGHNAIGIRDASANTDVVFNWGLFSFDEPGFIGRFLRGEMMYWMGGQDVASTIAQYRAINRTVEIQELNLSPPQRLALYDFIKWNARDENKFYRYDYFLDNCSTRVRDVLDQVLGGALRTATDTAATGTTYRWHALRLMAEDKLTVTGVDVGLGRPTDRPITEWEEMFIPMKVRDRVRELRVPDDSGRLVPLVTSERVVVQAQRTPERETPPPLLLPLGTVGLLLASALAWLGRGPRPGAVPAAVVTGFMLSIVGGALLFLRFQTQHVAAYDNTNLFAYNPIWWPLLLAMPFAGRSDQARRIVFLLATFTVALTAFGVVAPFLPGFRQGSFPVIALAAPLGLTAAWIIRERFRPDPTPTA